MIKFYRTYNFPFKYNIPNYIDFHLNNVNKFKRYLKYLKRYLYIVLKKQKKLEVFEIDSNHNNILWINISAPSLGDSIMDLSSRALLTDKSLDLFTDIKNAHIFKQDFKFTNVFTEFSQVKNIKYDLVILDSYSSRSVMVKSKIAPRVPYVGMFGFFNGPEVNRTLFSFHQMNNLLGYIYKEKKINSIAKNSISISKNDVEKVKQIIPNKYIAIVIGGEWKHKTYESWNGVINQIDNKNNIALIGSENAKRYSRELVDEFPEINFFDFVGKLTFNQTVEVINNSEILLCCDGGLMHAANAVNANVVSLFARLNADILLTENCISFNLYDRYDVNNIPVTDIVNKYSKARDSIFKSKNH